MISNQARSRWSKNRDKFGYDGSSFPARLLRPHRKYFRNPLGWDGREAEAETLPLGPANERRTALPGAVEINRPPGLDVTWLGAALAGRFGREVR